MKAWIARVVALRDQARSIRVPFSRETVAESERRNEIFRQTPGDYAAKIHAVAITPAPLMDAAVAEDRVRGFKICATLAQLAPGGPYVWHLSLSGTGKPEDRDEILRVFGVPPDARLEKLPFAWHWTWNDVKPPEAL